MLPEHLETIREKDSQIASLKETIKGVSEACQILKHQRDEQDEEIASLKELVAEKMNPMTMFDHMKWLNKAKELI